MASISAIMGLLYFVLALKGGECDSLNQVDTNLCVKCIQENKDIAVGVKIRLATMVTNDGQNEKEAFR